MARGVEVGGAEEGGWEVGAVVAHPAARVLSHPRPEEAVWDTSLVKRFPPHLIGGVGEELVEVLGRLLVVVGEEGEGWEEGSIARHPGRVAAVLRRAWHGAATLA